MATPTSGLLGKMASSGLLITYPNNKMRFTHPVFAGYLAGRALMNYNAEETILNQPDWSGKYLAMRYFAAHGDASKLVQALLEFSRLPMHRPLFAAARWLRDAPRNAPWRGKLFGTLAAILQTEGIPLNLRGQAMAAFVVSNDPSVMTLFRQFSTTLKFELVQLSVLGAGAMRDPKSVQILERAMEAPSQSVRHAACMALVAIGTNEALETVAHTLLNGDENIRRAAAEALANDPGEGHAMLRDGITINDILLRRAVAYGLGRVNEPWAVEALAKNTDRRRPVGCPQCRNRSSGIQDQRRLTRTLQIESAIRITLADRVRWQARCGHISRSACNRYSPACAKKRRPGYTPCRPALSKIHAERRRDCTTLCRHVQG